MEYTVRLTYEETEPLDLDLSSLLTLINNYWMRLSMIYILLDVLLCSIAEYFYELCRILASP